MLNLHQKFKHPGTSACRDSDPVNGHQHACKTITAKYTTHLSVSSASVDTKNKAKLSKAKIIY